LEFFATAAKGTEPAVRDELREHRFRGVRADRGGVHFHGPLEEGFRACLELRTASRVLVEVGAFDAPSGDALYEGARGIDWAVAVSPRTTIAVRASCRSSALTHTQFIAQRTKDAICDQLRDRVGARPSVDLEDPDVVVSVHLAKDRATIYLDLAGEPLHLRGWRAQAGEAPLKESLAAAMLRLGGWDRSRPLVDPMCGSGTIAIEAALWARDVAPGIARARFGVERWASHDDAERARFREMRDRARARVRRDGPRVVGSDVDPRAIAIARENARLAGVSIELEVRPLRDLRPTTPPAHVVTNPPYGERLPAERAFLRELGDAIATLHGHRVTMLAGSPALLRAVPRRAEKELAVWNGPIECRLASWEIP
jgi:putative N6-adenine-specific DNA methylase